MSAADLKTKIKGVTRKAVSASAFRRVTAASLMALRLVEAAADSALALLVASSRNRRLQKAFASLQIFALFLSLFSWVAFMPNLFGKPKEAEAAKTYQFTPTGGELVIGTETTITSATAAAATDGTNVGSWRGTTADDGYHWTVSSISGSFPDSGINMQLIVGGVALNGANTMSVQTEIDQSSALGSIQIQICDWVSSSGVDSAADAQCTGGGWRTLNNRKQAISASTATAYHWNIYDGYWADGSGNSVSTPLSNFVNGSNEVRVRYFTTASNVLTTAIDFLRVSAFVSPLYAASGLFGYTGKSGIISNPDADDSDYIEAMAVDGQYMYLAGSDDSYNWRYEKRRVDTGARDPGFGTNGSTTSATDSYEMMAMALDADYMYAVGTGNSGVFRIEKRSKSNGELASGFGTNGVATGDATSNEAYAVAVDATYVYVAGKDVNGDIRIEKRLISDGSLVSGFGTNGVATSDASSNRVKDIAIDSTYMYVVGADDSFDLRIEKRLLSDGSLVPGFGTSGRITAAGGGVGGHSLAIDSTHMYVLTVDKGSSWRVEKRLLTDGSLVPGFGVGGATYGWRTMNSREIVIDGSHMFVATSWVGWNIHKRSLETGAPDVNFGDDGTLVDDVNANYNAAVAVSEGSVYSAGSSNDFNWRVTKRDADTGEADLDFGDNATGPALYTPYSNTNTITQGASDGSFAMFGGTGVEAAPAIAYFTFDNVKTYEGMNTAMVRAESSCSTTVAEQYRFVIYNFAESRWEVMSGWMDCSTTDAINEFTKASTNIGNYISGGEMRVGIEVSDGNHVVQIDQIYMMLGSTNADANSCQATFGSQTGGGVSSNFSAPGSDQATTLATDGTHMYIGGFDSMVYGANWHIQKRSLATGDLDPTFGKHGNISNSYSTNADQITTIKADSDYLYVGGYYSFTSTNQNWRIEKRYKSHGGLVADFGSVSSSPGATTSAPSANNDKIVSMEVDGGYLYVLGEERSGGTSNAEWRIEKRDATAGALVSGFGTNGVISYNATAAAVSSAPGAIRVDDTYLYVAGGMTNGTSMTWQIEKRDKGTGSLVNGFGVNGVVNSDLTNANEAITDMEIDGTYMYVAGVDYIVSSTNSQWRIEKRLVSDGSLVNGFGTNGVIQVDLFTDNDPLTDIAIDGSYIYAVGAEDDDTGAWRLEKRDITTGSLVTAFDSDGFVYMQDGADDRATAVKVDGGHVYVAGYGTGPGDNQWLVEKRDATTGERVSAGFNPTTCAGTRDMDTSSGDGTVWAIQTEDESTSFLHDFFARDNDGDGTVEEAAAATLDFNVTVPNGATVVSNFYASRHISGVGGSVQVAIKDYGGSHGAIGGRSIVGTTGTSAMTYTDPVVTTGVGANGYNGFVTNPEDNVDTLNNKMSLSLVTTADGTTNQNSTAVWDFAMVSIGWVEEASSRPPGTYQFVPVGGELVFGSTATTTSATASGAADGTNVGSWKGTLADDGYHWTVYGGSFRADLVVGGVLLNGANTLMIQTELDQATTPGTANVAVMVCDWVSSVGVWMAADGQCPGGWRILNNREIGLQTGTATAYHWNIYDGYWSNTANEPIPTPLSNFVSPSNQLRIRYYNISGNTGTVAIDFLRASAVISPVYAPADATAPGYGIMNSSAVSYGLEDLEMDATHEYAFGYSQAFRPYIEKRSRTTGELDTSFGDLGSISPAINYVIWDGAIDATYMYVVGEGCNNVTDCYYGARVEKRLLSDGSFDAGFGTGGTVSSYANFQAIHSIAIDGTYMYLVGYAQSANDWYIEKRLLSDGSLVSGFGTNGAITSDAASQIANRIVIDGTYMYVFGTDATGWRIEKRLLSDGSLVSGFGTNGVVTPDPASKLALALTADDMHLYLGGSDDSGNWRIEKRLLSDGSLVNGFGTSGVVTGVAATDEVFEIRVDSTHMYVSGDDSSSLIRVEKRWLTSGTLDGGFGTTGIMTGDSTSRYPGGLQIDDTNMYIGGQNSSNDWRFEKRLLSDGSLANGFGSSLSGDYVNTNVITQGASDNTYLSVTGTASSSAEMYFSFKNVKTYTGMNTILVRAETSCSAITAGLSYKFRVYNFSTSAWDDISSSLECHTTDATNVFATSSVDVSDYISGGEMRIGMYANAPHATTALRSDMIYMMLGTTNTDENSCQVTFGSETGGRVASNPSSQSDQILAVATDASYVYLAGFDMQGGDVQWRIEKRDKSTGELVSGFGTGGVVQSDPTANNDQATAIAVDADYIYIGGFESASASNQNWRVEKRDKTTGALINAFDSDGVYLLAVSSNNDKITAIAVDSSKIYLAGEQRFSGTSNANWHLVSLDKTTAAGSISVSSEPTTGNDIAYAVATDGTYIYVVGSEATGTNAWRIEKRDATLNLVNGFGTNGVITEDNAGGADEIFAMDIDGTYMYLAGYDSATTNNQWRIEKRLLSDGSLETTTFGSATGIVQTNPSANTDKIYAIGVDGSYIYVAGEDRTESTSLARWRIEKRSISTGALETSFNSDGIALAQDGGDDRPTALTIDGSSLFVAGYGTAPGDNQWLAEKYDASTGLREASGFGATSCAGTRDVDTTASERATWALQTEDESTTFGHTYIARDNDGDATVEEAASATLDFGASVPADAMVAGIYYAGRFVGGAAGSVQTGIKDYSGLTSVTGGRSLVGTAQGTGMGYSDNITLGSVNTGGAAGFYTNPEDHIDTVNGKMSMSLMTTASGATTEDSVPAWDFAMMSFSWIEPSRGVTISGTVFGPDGSTPLASQPSIKVVVGDSTSYTVTAESDGTWSVDLGSVPASGTVITAWANGGSDRASLALVYGNGCNGSPSCTNLSLVEDSVTLYGRDGNSMTNSTLAVCDNDSGASCTDTDIGYTSNSGALALTWQTPTLKIATGTTYVPDGNVTAWGLDVAGTMNLDTNDPAVTLAGDVTIGGALTASASSTLVFGGDWTNNGTFTHSSGTVDLTFDGESVGTVGGSSLNTFYNFSVLGSGKTLRFKSAATTTFEGALSLAGDGSGYLSVESDQANSQWLMLLAGSATASFAIITDSGCAIGSLSPSFGYNVQNGGNNGSCWSFRMLTFSGSWSAPIEGGDGGGTPVDGGTSTSTPPIEGGDGGGSGSTGGGSQGDGGGGVAP